MEQWVCHCLTFSDLKMKAGWRDSQIPPDPSSKTAAAKHSQNEERLRFNTRLSGTFDDHLSAEDGEIEGGAR